MQYKWILTDSLPVPEVACDGRVVRTVLVDAGGDAKRGQIWVGEGGEWEKGNALGKYVGCSHLTFSSSDTGLSHKEVHKADAALVFDFRRKTF